MNSKSKIIIINVLLLAVVVFLSIKVVQSIQGPIHFNSVKTYREKQIKQRLLDIREIEILYKQAHNKYTSNFDTLIDFCSNYEIPIVMMVPDPEDTTFTKTINDTLGYVKVIDTLFGKRPNFNINELKFVPSSDPLVQFEIQDSIIKRGGISVPVIEVKTPYDVYLTKVGERFELEDYETRDESKPKDTRKVFSEKEWKTRVQNAKAEMEQLEKYAGMKFGSLEEATTDGNWEKL